MSKPQLFCFTHAGGSASFFDLIERDFADTELVKLEYAGHATRRNESFYTSYDELADDIFGLVKKSYSGGQYGLFGYSMGAITTVEVLRRILDDSKMEKPGHVFLAAHEPHSKAELKGYSECETDDWVKERTIQFGAVPDRLLSNKSFWRMYLPLYRADYSLIGSYQFQELSLRTEIPVTVFYSDRDTPRTEMELWRRYFIGESDFYEYSGNHFFIADHHKEMASVMELKLH